MSKVIYVCTTCDRNASNARQTSRGSLLLSDMRAHIAASSLTQWCAEELTCLNGCLRPCNVAFRGRDRFTFRFSQVLASDIPALLTFGETYWHESVGAVSHEHIAPALRDKLSLCTPPNGRW